MIIPPYLRATDLKPRMWERPVIPFFVRPQDYRVVDGDTIKLLAAAPRGERRQDAFRIRFASVDAPEKPWMFSGDKILETLGVDPNPDHGFSRITDALRNMIADRVLLIEPYQDPRHKDTKDGHGRLLAYVSASGDTGNLFVPDGAFNVEHVMLEQGLVRPLKDRQVPPVRTELLDRLSEFVAQKAAKGMEREDGERPSY